VTAGALLLAAAVTNVTGVLTFEREGLPFYFMRADDGVCWRVERPAGFEAKPGDRIEASGAREQTVKHRIKDASIVNRGPDPGGVPPPREIALDELFDNVMPFGNTKWYGATFTTEGMLRDINRRQATTQLLVGEGERNLQVEMPWALETSLPHDLVLGCRVRVTGVLAYTSIEDVAENYFGRIENLELIPMGDDDLEIVRRAPEPPFWTGERLAWLFAAAAAVFLALFVWNAALRIAVARRSRELAESIRQRETAKIEADASRRERLRLAADLHDGFQQYLAGAMFRLKAARNYLPHGATRCGEQLEKVQEALQHTQNGLRSTIWAMNEESEGPESLSELFRFVARRMGHWEGVVEIRSEGEERAVARNFCGTLLLVMQEAVGNAIRHGKARHVVVKTVFGDGELTLEVSDDGCGFDPSALSGKGHYGLGTMERRITELGGTMRVKSAPGRGSTLVFAVPA